MNTPTEVEHFSECGEALAAGVGAHPVDAEALARAFLQNNTVAVFGKDRDGRYTLVNAKCESLWEKTADQILGKTDADLLPEQDAADVTEHDREVLEAGKTLEFEESIAYPGGRRTFLTSKIPLRDRSGHILGLCGVATDITDRRAAERRMEESETRFRLLADTAPLLVWMSDDQKRRTYFNRSWLELTGRRLDQELGSGWRESVHRDDLDALTVCEEAFENRTPFTTQFRLRAANGAYRWVLDSGRPRFDRDGEFVGFIGCCADVTELYESARAKDEFLAVLGHELRNPLTPLNTAVSLLEQGRRDPKILDTIEPMMQRQLTHLNRLVHDLIDLSRISKGKIDLQKATFDLNVPVDVAIEQVKDQITQRKHHLNVELSDVPLSIDGDVERVTEVLTNLLSNAVKYTAPGGNIRVRSHEEDGLAVVRVADDGFGIPAAATDIIFKLFRQIPEHRSRTGGGGLGIGLALSKQLIDLHGGSIEVKSGGIDCGSEFIVRLPMAISDTSYAASDRRSKTTEKARRILVVDDNVDAADSFQMILEQRGHTVEVAYDGPDALALVRSFTPEVVLLDLGLPGLRGDEVARRIRAMPGGENLLLVCITGWGEEKDRLLSTEAGFDRHLVKPVEAKELISLISE